MLFKDWINEVIKSGNLCSHYTEKVQDAPSKRRLVDLCLDPNGVSYLQEMQAKGMGLAYETILTEFKSYINGRYIAEFKNEKGNGYTSSIYCCYFDSDTINVNTTLVSLLGCKSKVNIAENDFVRICVDKNCELIVNCPQSSRCIIEYWGNAKIQVNGNVEKVVLIARK
jgi:hypothetical protein